MCLTCGCSSALLSLGHGAGPSTAISSDAAAHTAAECTTAACIAVAASDSFGSGAISLLLRAIASIGCCFGLSYPSAGSRPGAEPESSSSSPSFSCECRSIACFDTLLLKTSSCRQSECGSFLSTLVLRQGCGTEQRKDAAGPTLPSNVCLG